MRLASPRRPVAVAVVVSLLGLLIMSVGYAMGWHSGPGGHPGWRLPAFYAGYAIVVAPYAFLLMRRGLARREIVAACVALGLTTYLSWLLANPLMATRFDETLHVGTELGLIRHGFFTANPMLPVSPYFPGMELATIAVSWATGLPLMACQVIVVAISRVVLVVCLFWIAERLTGSARVAGVTVLLYSASSQFWFFNAQFAYQTAALALLLGTFFWVLRAVDADRAGARARLPLLLGLVCIATLMITHHVTSWLVVPALGGWSLLLLIGRRPRAAAIVGVAAVCGLGIGVGWALVVGQRLNTYFTPLLESAGDQAARLVGGGGGGRHVFTSGTGAVTTPAWERYLLVVSVLVWLTLLAPSAYAALRGWTFGRSRQRWLLLVVAAAYPVALGLRVIPDAAGLGERSTTFIVLAAAIVIAAWLVPRVLDGRRIGPARTRRPRRRRSGGEWTRVRWLPSDPSAVIALAVVVLSLGGCVLGSGPDWSRINGPYLPGAEQRSVDAQTLATARWVASYVPPGSRIAADQTFARVLPDYADIVPVTAISGSVDVTPVFIRYSVDDYVRGVLRSGKVDFLVVDTRLNRTPVQSGSFFEGTQGYGDINRSSAEQLSKFANVEGFTKVLDGPVQIYDVRGLRGEPATFTERKAPLLPGGHGRPWQMGLTAIAVVVGLWFYRKRMTFDIRARGVGALVLVLPVLVAVGAVGVLVGLPVDGGLAALAVLVDLAVLARGAARVQAMEHPVRVGPALLATLLLCGSVEIAGVAAWNGFVTKVATPDPPVTVTAKGVVR